jgi:hypothetical protein
MAPIELGVKQSKIKPNGWWNTKIMLIRFARACSTYDQFLIRRSLLTRKFMSQGFLQSRLQAALLKFYGRYNDLVCQYNLSLGQIFITNR